MNKKLTQLLHQEIAAFKAHPNYKKFRTEDFDPLDGHLCVYGQMFGSYDSEEAVRFKQKFMAPEVEEFKANYNRNTLRPGTWDREYSLLEFLLENSYNCSPQHKWVNDFMEVFVGNKPIESLSCDIFT